MKYIIIDFRFAYFILNLFREEYDSFILFCYQTRHCFYYSTLRSTEHLSFNFCIYLEINDLDEIFTNELSLIYQEISISHRLIMFHVTRRVEMKIDRIINFVWKYVNRNTLYRESQSILLIYEEINL